MSAAIEQAPGLDAWLGRLEVATRERLEGWVYHEATPNKAINLSIECDGESIGRVTANRYREDLKQAGIGDGRHAFSIALPALSARQAHVIRVIADEAGELPGSPISFQPIPQFDESLQETVGAALAGLETRDEREEAYHFLMAHAQRLKSSLSAEARRGREPSPFPDQAPRALFIVEQVPRADDAVHAPVILSHVTSLQQLGYVVSLVGADELSPPSSSIARLEALNIECCRMPDYASVEELLRRDPERFALVYVHGGASAERYLSLARRYCRNARLVYSVGELHTIRLARQAAILKRPMLQALSNRRHLAECSAASIADTVITHSGVEADWLRQTLGSSNVHVVPWLVPTVASRRSWSQRSGIAMLADFADPANIDAAQCLATQIMPLVRGRNPDFECVLAGPHMPESLYKLPNVVPIGQVADTSQIYERVRLTIAPQRFGSGVNGAALASMAAGIPCVMSSVAAEGINLPVQLLRLVAVEPARLAALILLLHDDERRGIWMAEIGRAFVHSNFGEQQVLNGLRNALTPELH